MSTKTTEVVHSVIRVYGGERCLFHDELGWSHHPLCTEIRAAITAARAEGERVGHERGVAEEMERLAGIAAYRVKRAQDALEVEQRRVYARNELLLGQLEGRADEAEVFRDAIASGEKP